VEHPGGITTLAGSDEIDPRSRRQQGAHWQAMGAVGVVITEDDWTAVVAFGRRTAYYMF
jgi:hypothetical protein